MMDYCTLFPEGWWAHCCAAHDAAYLAQSGKAAADAALLQCVAGTGFDPLTLTVAIAMFSAVSLFGGYFYRRAGKERA